MRIKGWHVSTLPTEGCRGECRHSGLKPLIRILYVLLVMWQKMVGGFSKNNAYHALIHQKRK